MASITRDMLIEALSMGTSKIPKRARERAETGCCLVPDCKDQSIGRGLCVRHRNEFYYRLRNLRSKSAQLEYEQQLIRRGLLLPVGSQQTIRRDQQSVLAFRDSEAG